MVDWESTREHHTQRRPMNQVNRSGQTILTASIGIARVDIATDQQIDLLSARTAHGAMMAKDRPSQRQLDVSSRRK